MSPCHSRVQATGKKRALVCGALFRLGTLARLLRVHVAQARVITVLHCVDALSGIRESEPTHW
jgi:hypothetical protein